VSLAKPDYRVGHPPAAIMPSLAIAWSTRQPRSCQARSPDAASRQRGGMSLLSIDYLISYALWHSLMRNFAFRHFVFFSVFNLTFFFLSVVINSLIFVQFLPKFFLSRAHEVLFLDFFC
jgi:hypothetical protein